MLKAKLKNFLLFFISIFVTFLFINFILIKISSQNIFPRPLAASLPNTLLTFYPDTYNKKNLENFTAVLGNSVAQGGGDSYLKGENNYSITHHLHDIKNKNYLIFARAGHNSMMSVINLTKVHALSNKSFMLPDLNKPNSIIFYFYEGIDLWWNYSLYKNYSKQNESVESFVSRTINDNSAPNLFEKFENSFPIFPFVGTFFEDFAKLFKEIFKSGSLKESISLIFDRIKKLFGFYILLGDREKNDLTWTNSLKNHKSVNNIRPIQGAGITLNKNQMLIGLNVFFNSLNYAKSWANTKNVYILYIPAPITVYDWKEPIIYAGQALSPRSKDDVKSITNKQNRIKNIFLRNEIQIFSEKNDITFLDPSDLLIEEGKSKLLHGPLDWGHMNHDGYKVVSEFLVNQIN